MEELTLEEEMQLRAKLVKAEFERASILYAQKRRKERIIGIIVLASAIAAIIGLAVIAISRFSVSLGPLGGT